METNKLAAQFVKRLVAAFPRFPVSKETIELYTGKLSKWTLRPEQWGAAIDILINREDENIPALNEVYQALKTASYSDVENRASDYGWIYFSFNDHQYAIRVVYREGEWVVANLEAKDAHGQTRQMQKNVGMPAMSSLPDGAINISFAADKPERMRSEAAA